MRRLWHLAPIALLAACAWRPARFSDAPPITAAADDSPIPQPRPNDLDQREYLAEVYMRQPVMESLDVSRPSEAGDVNAVDEAVKSSWFDPDPTRLASLKGYTVDGPPLSPLKLVGGAGTPTLSVVDARGLRYRIRRDLPDRAEMRTAADAITNRLLWAVGYLTPEVHIVQVHPEDFPTNRSEAAAWLHSDGRAQSSHRVSATRWPVGVDLGPAPAALTRADDPNDQIPHRDRRTLRALRVLGAWLDLKTLGPQKTLDAYAGVAGCGHVVHFLAGFEDTLGAARVSIPVPRGSPRPDCGPNLLLNLATLGFYPNPPPGATERKFLTLGAIDVSVDPEHYHPDLPPYEPFEHALPQDGYWAARRMMSLTSSVIRAAIEGGVLTEPGAGARLGEILEARRRKVATWWFSQVTPVLIASVDGTSLVMHDDAVGWGLVAADRRDYRLEFLDHRGTALVAPMQMKPRSACWSVTVPGSAQAPYIIVRVTAVLAGKAQAKGVEFHLALHKGRVRLIGVRH